MTKCKMNRGVAMLLALVLSLCTLAGFATPAYAASGEQKETVMIGFPRDGDANYGDWGHGDLQYMNGWTANKSTHNNIYAMGDWTGNICYCIEPGVPLAIGDVFTERDETYWDNYPDDYNHTITPYEIKLLIGRILQYGYTGTVSSSWRSQNSDDAAKMSQAIATQMLVWETVIGERDSDFNHVSPGSGLNVVTDTIGADHPLRSQIFNYYNNIVSSVQKHSKIPSFCSKSTGKAKTVSLDWDGSQYKAVLTDTNGVLSDYSFSADDSNIKFSVSGNTLTITATTAPSKEISITANKASGQRKGLIVWDDGKYAPNEGRQNTVTFVQSVNDPIKAYVNIKVSTGNVKIVKTSEDGNVSGITFTITGNGVNETLKTDGKGVIQINNLAPGTYTVKENNSDYYEPQSEQTVTVNGGQTVSVEFNNTLKRGTLTIIKTAEDNLVEGVKFHLYGKSNSGVSVDEYAVTDKSGKATFTDILIGSGYVIEEVDTAIRYVVPEAQTGDIEWNKVTEKTVNNVLKKFAVTVTKTDDETSTPQGDATLAGAVYGIYNNGELVDTYSTDANGQFTSKYYVCGNDWELREITPSEGYLLNESVYHIGAEAKLYTVELNSTANDVDEHIIKGKLSIIKHCDNGDTQIETPEVGAIFEIYLKSSGSYKDAAETERDKLTCDENGFAESKMLPYGNYVVHQVAGWDGREIMKDFDVYVCEDGHTYRYLINNAIFESYIKVVKTDSETGKTIPYAGAGFKILDPDGNPVTMTYTYPEKTVIDTFYTTSDGTLITPEKLEYGKGYSIVEVSAPYGYVLDETPVVFDIVEDNSSSDGDITLVIVEKTNAPQKGKIEITKTGEIFASVTEADGMYQPVYEIGGLEGATYEIVASEDITTPDGTVRYENGSVVDTVTTKTDGKAVSKELYLGKYTIREITAPFGMVLNNEPQTVELVYAGQTVAVTETYASFCNERQKAEISLSKTMEQDELFHIGNNGEMLNVTFGLYASEDLTAADGKAVPANGLIEVVACNENGSAVFVTDIPVGAKCYVKEIGTDAHYIVSEDTFGVTFEYAGQGKDCVSIIVNNGDAITNELIRGAIRGVKVDEDGNTISGALFGLFSDSEDTFSEDTAIITRETNGEGIFIFENIPYGNYIVREIVPAEGFVLNETEYPVNIEKDNELIEIGFENLHITGSVQTTKVDAEYPENKLTGAEFEIYLDVDSNGEYSVDIDILIGTMAEAEPGVYVYDGLRYGAYLLYEKAAPEGFLKDDNYYSFEIRENGKTVIVENKAGVGFMNKPIISELEITKVDIADGKLLPNAGFRIKDADGNTVVEGRTDENGIAKFTLRYGKYTYEEFDAPEGYQLDTTPFEFEVKENGQILKATVTNEKIPEPDVPQTGDNSNLGFWIGLGAIALGGLIATAIIFIKKKKGDDDQ